MEKNTLDYTALVLGGKTNTDIESASKLQNFDVNILDEKTAFEKYGAENKMSEQDFSKFYNNQIIPKFREYQTGNFLKNDLRILNRPNYKSLVGDNVPGLGTPVNTEAPDNQMFRDYGLGATQINTPAEVAEGNKFYYLDGQKVPFTSIENTFGTPKLDDKAQKLLDNRDMLLVAKPDPNDESSVAWVAMPKTAAVSHEILRSTFGQNFSMFKDNDILRSLAQNFSSIVGGLGHMGETINVLGNLVQKRIGGTGHEYDQYIEDRRRLQNWSGQVKNAAEEDSAEGINAFKATSAIAQIGEMMLVGGLAYKAAGAVLGTGAVGAELLGEGSVEANVLRTAFQNAARSEGAGAFGAAAGLTEGSIKQAGMFREQGKAAGISDTDLAFLYPAVFALNYATETFAIGDLVNFSGSKAFGEFAGKELFPLLKAAQKEAGVETMAGLPKETILQTIKGAFEKAEGYLNKTRIGSGISHGIGEAIQEGVQNPLQNSVNAFYDLAAPTINKLAGRKNDDLRTGNGLFGQNFSDIFEGDLENMALGFIGGSFGGLVHKPISTLNSGVNNLLKQRAEAGPTWKQDNLNLIEEYDKGNKSAFGPEYLTPPKEGGQVIPAGGDKSKSWNAFNKQRAIDIVTMVDKLYNEQGGKHLTDLATMGDAVANEMLNDLQKPQGLIHQSLFANFKSEVLKDKIAALEEKVKAGDQKAIEQTASLQTDLAEQQQKASEIWDGKKSLRFNELYNDKKASLNPDYKVTVENPNPVGGPTNGYQYFRKLNTLFAEAVPAITERNKAVQEQFDVARGTMGDMTSQLQAKGYDIKNPEIVGLLGKIHEMMPQIGIASEQANQVTDYLNKMQEHALAGIEEGTADMNLISAIGTEQSKFKSAIERSVDRGAQVEQVPETPFDMVNVWDDKTRQYNYVTSVEPTIQSAEQRLESGDKMEGQEDIFKNLVKQLNFVKALAIANDQTWNKYTPDEKVFHDTEVPIPSEQLPQVIEKLDNHIKRVNEIVNKITILNEGYRTVQQNFVYQKATFEKEFLGSFLQVSGQDELLKKLGAVQLPTIAEHMTDPTKLAEAQAQAYKIMRDTDKKKIFKALPGLIAKYNAGERDFNRNIQDYEEKDISKIYDYTRFTQLVQKGEEATDSDKSEIQLILFNTLNDIYKFKGIEVAAKLKEMFADINESELGITKDGKYPSLEHEEMLHTMYAHMLHPSNELWEEFGKLVSPTGRTKNNFQEDLNTGGSIKNMITVRGPGGAGKTTLTRTVIKLMDKKNPKVLIVAPSKTLRETFAKATEGLVNGFSFLTPSELLKEDLQNYDLIIYDEVSTITHTELYESKKNKGGMTLVKKLNEVNVPIFGLGDDNQIVGRDEDGLARTFLPIFEVAPRTTMMTWKFRTGQESLWRLSTSIINAISLTDKTRVVNYPDTVYDEAMTKGVKYYQNNEEMMADFRKKFASDPTTVLMAIDFPTIVDITGRDWIGQDGVPSKLSALEIANIKPVESNKTEEMVSGSEFPTGFVYNIENYDNPNYIRFLNTAATRPTGFLGITANGKSVVGEDRLMPRDQAETIASYKDFIKRQEILSKDSEVPKRSSSEEAKVNPDSQQKTIEKLKKGAEGVEITVTDGISHYVNKLGQTFQRASSYRKAPTSTIKDSDSVRGTHTHAILETLINGGNAATLAELGPKKTGSTANRTSTIKNIEQAITVFNQVIKDAETFGTLVPEVTVTTDGIKAKRETGRTGIAGTLDIAIVNTGGAVKIYDLKTRSSASQMSDEAYLKERTAALNTYKEILEAAGYTVENTGRIAEVIVDLSLDGYTVENMKDLKFIDIPLKVAKAKPVTKQKVESGIKKVVNKRPESDQQSKFTTKDGSSAVTGKDEKAMEKGVLKIVDNSIKEGNVALPSSTIVIGKREAEKMGITASEEASKLLARKNYVLDWINRTPGVGMVAKYYADIRTADSPIFVDNEKAKAWDEYSKKRNKLVGQYADGSYPMPAVSIELDINDDKVKALLHHGIFGKQSFDDKVKDGMHLISTMWLPEASPDPNRTEMNKELLKFFNEVKEKGQVSVQPYGKIAPGLVKISKWPGGGSLTNLTEFETKAEQKGFNVSQPYMIVESADDRHVAEESGDKVNWYVDVTFRGEGDAIRVKVEPGTIKQEYMNRLQDSVNSWKQYDTDFAEANKKGETERNQIRKDIYANNEFWQVLKQNRAILLPMIGKIPHLVKTEYESYGETREDIGLTKGKKGEKMKTPYSEQVQDIYDYLKDNNIYHQMKMWERPNFDRIAQDEKGRNKYEMHPEATSSFDAWADDVYAARFFFQLADVQKNNVTTTNGKIEDDSIDFPDYDPTFMLRGTEQSATFTSEENARKLLVAINAEFMEGRLEFKPKVIINGKEAWGALYNGQVLIESNEDQVHTEVARHERVHIIISHFLDTESQRKVLDAAKKQFGVNSDGAAEEQLARYAGPRYDGIKGQFNKIVDQFLGWLHNTLVKFNIHKFELNSFLAQAEQNYWADKEPVNTTGVIRTMMKLEEEFEENEPEKIGKTTWLNLATQFGDANWRDTVFKTILSNVNRFTIDNRKLNVKEDDRNLSDIEAIDRVRGEYKRKAFDLDKQYVKGMTAKILNDGNWASFTNQERKDYTNYLLSQDSVYQAMIERQYPAADVTYEDYVDEDDTIAQAQRAQYVDSGLTDPDTGMSKRLENMLRTIKQAAKILPGNAIQNEAKMPFLNIENAKHVLNTLSGIANLSPEGWLSQFNQEERMFAYLAQKQREAGLEKQNLTKQTIQSIVSVIGGPDEILSVGFPQMGSLRERIANDTLTWWDYARNSDSIKEINPDLAPLVDAKMEHANSIINSLIDFYKGVTVVNNTFTEKDKFGNFKTDSLIPYAWNDIKKAFKDKFINTLFEDNGTWQVRDSAIKNYSNVDFTDTGITIKGEKVIDVKKSGKNYSFSFTATDNGKIVTDVNEIRQVMQLLNLQNKTIESYLQTDKGKKELAETLGTLMYASKNAILHGEFQKPVEVKEGEEPAKKESVKFLPSLMEYLRSHNQISELTSINRELSPASQIDEETEEKPFLRPDHFYEMIEGLAREQAGAMDKNSMMNLFFGGARHYNRVNTSHLLRVLGGQQALLPEGVTAESIELTLLSPAVVAKIDGAIQKLQVDIQDLNNRQVKPFREINYLKNKVVGLQLLRGRVNMNMNNMVLNKTIRFGKLEKNLGLDLETSSIDPNNMSPLNTFESTLDTVISQLGKAGTLSSFPVLLAQKSDKNVMQSVMTQFTNNGKPINWFKSGSLEMTDEAWQKAVQHTEASFNTTKMLRDASLNRLATVFNDHRFSTAMDDKSVQALFDEAISKIEGDKMKFLYSSGLMKNHDFIETTLEKTNGKWNTLDPKYRGKVLIPGNSAFGDIALANYKYTVYDNHIKQAGKTVSSEVLKHWEEERRDAKKALYKYSHFNSEVFNTGNYTDKVNWIKTKFSNDYYELQKYMTDNQYEIPDKVKPEGSKGFYTKEKKPIGFYEAYMHAYHIVNAETGNLLDGHPFNFGELIKAFKYSAQSNVDGHTGNTDDPQLGHQVHYINLMDPNIDRTLIDGKSKKVVVTDGQVKTHFLFQARAHNAWGGKGGMVSENGTVKWSVSQVDNQMFTATEIKCAGMAQTEEYLKMSPKLMEMSMNAMSPELRTVWSDIYKQEVESNPEGAFKRAVARTNEHIDNNDMHDHYAAFYVYDSTQKGTSANVYDYEDFAAGGGFNPNHPGRQTLMTQNLRVVLNTAKEGLMSDSKPMVQLDTTLAIDPRNAELFKRMTGIEVKAMADYKGRTEKEIADNFETFLRKMGLIKGDKSQNDIHFAELIRNPFVDINNRTLQTKLMQFFVNNVNDGAVKQKVPSVSGAQQPLDEMKQYAYPNAGGLLYLNHVELQNLKSKLGDKSPTEEQTSPYYAFDMIDGKVEFGSAGLAFPYVKQFGLEKGMQPKDVTLVVSKDGVVNDLTIMNIAQIVNLLKSDLTPDGLLGSYNNWIIQKFLTREKGVVSYQADIEKGKIQDVEVAKGYDNTADMPYGYIPEVAEKLRFNLTNERILNMAKEISEYVANFELAREVFLNRDPSNPSSGGWYKNDLFFYDSSNTILVPSEKTAIDDSDNDYDSLKGNLYAFDRNGKLATKGIRAFHNQKMDLRKEFYFNPINSDKTLMPIATTEWVDAVDNVKRRNSQFHDLGTNYMNKEIANAGRIMTGVLATQMANVALDTQATINSQKSGIPIRGTAKTVFVGENGVTPTQSMAGLVQLAVDNVKLMAIGALGITKYNANLVVGMVSTGYSPQRIVDILQNPLTKSVFARLQGRREKGEGDFEATLKSLNTGRQDAESKVYANMRYKEDFGGIKLTGVKEENFTQDMIPFAYEKAVKDKAELMEQIETVQDGQIMKTDQDEIARYDRIINAYPSWQAIQAKGLFDELEHLIYKGESINNMGAVFQLRNGIDNNAQERYNREFNVMNLLSQRISDFVAGSGDLNHDWKAAYRFIVPASRREQIIKQQTKLREYRDARGVVANLPAFVKRLEMFDWVNQYYKNTFISEMPHKENVREIIQESQAIAHPNESQYYEGRNNDDLVALYYTEKAYLQPEFYNYLEPFKQYMRTIQGVQWNNSVFDWSTVNGREIFKRWFPEMVEWIQQNGSNLIAPEFKTNQFINNLTVKEFQGKKMIVNENSADDGPDVLTKKKEGFTKMRTYSSEQWGNDFGDNLAKAFKMYTDLVYGESFKKGHIIELMDAKSHESFGEWLTNYKSKLKTEGATFVVGKDGLEVSIDEVYGQSLATQKILKGDKRSPFIARDNKDNKNGPADRVPQYFHAIKKTDKGNYIPDQVYLRTWNKAGDQSNDESARLIYSGNSNNISFDQPLNELVVKGERVFNRISTEQLKRLINGLSATIVQKGFKLNDIVWINGIQSQVTGVNEKNPDIVTVAARYYQVQKEELNVPEEIQKNYKEVEEMFQRIKFAGISFEGKQLQKIENLKDIENQAIAIIKSTKGDDKYLFLSSQKHLFGNDLRIDDKQGERVKGVTYKGIDIVSEYFEHKFIDDKSGGDKADILFVDSKEDAQKQFDNYIKGGAKQFSGISYRIANNEQDIKSELKKAYENISTLDLLSSTKEAEMQKIVDNYVKEKRECS